jgi:hypothetical protein
MNSFAISGQFFNFSTSGQWLWDEIRVTIPNSRYTYNVIEAIHKAVEQQTAENAKSAEMEWQRATQQQGLSQFRAASSVDLRPAAAGVEVVVRYVTRAGDRFATRNQLYQTVLDLMEKNEEQHALETEEKHA